MGWVKREKYECNIVIFYATFGAAIRQNKYRVMRGPPENFMDLVLGEVTYDNDDSVCSVAYAV